jgi:hypothetical protein
MNIWRAIGENRFAISLSLLFSVGLPALLLGLSAVGGGLDERGWFPVSPLRLSVSAGPIGNWHRERASLSSLAYRYPIERMR